MSWTWRFPRRRGPNDDRFASVWFRIIKTECCRAVALHGRRGFHLQFGKVSCSNVANPTMSPRSLRMLRSLPASRLGRRLRRRWSPSPVRAARKHPPSRRSTTVLVSRPSAPLRQRMRKTCPDRRSRLLLLRRPRQPLPFDRVRPSVVRHPAIRRNVERSLSAAGSVFKALYRMPSGWLSRGLSKRR